MDDSTERALQIARELIAAGVPVFAAPPCPASRLDENGVRGYCGRNGHAGGSQEYDLPSKWQMTIPATVWLERWQPGWALAAVGGHTADFLDEDPRNGGDASIERLTQAGEMPRVFGVQATPSGGRHYLISPIGMNKSTGFLDGLDYQGGGEKAQGRGFVWIAPTVKRSKTDGVPRAYEWLQDPDMDYLAEFNGDGFTDDSLEALRGHIDAFRNKRREGIDRSATTGERREFSREQMDHFLAGPVLALRTAEIGHIEERANGLACSLSHFVPSMLSEEQAFEVLMDALGETAYDPAHPASGWDADKFYAVIAGEVRRTPGDWVATYRPENLREALDTVPVAGDEVTRLLAEMVAPSELAGRRPPRYMVKGLLTYDSAAWVIGGPGSKKSFVVMDMAAHVAMGKPWQGHRVNPGLVVMIVGEGAGSIGKRVAAWHKINGPMPDARLRVLPRPVQAGDPKAWAVLVQACARLRASLDDDLGMLVIIDTQARSTVGMDENAADEMGQYVDAVDAIKVATRGCVLTVHHTRKDGTTTRGSSALDGAQDTRLKVESESGSLDAVLSVDKQKDLDPIDPVRLRFQKVDLGLDSDGEPYDSLVMVGHDAWRAGEHDDESLDAAGQGARAEVEPFVARFAPEPWTFVRTTNRADTQRWLLQALADVAEERGLTQAEWRGVVEEKTGKLGNSTWRKAFQMVTSSRFEGLVSFGATGDRWVIDPVQRAAEVLSES